MKKGSAGLTDREYKVMDVLWKAEKSMTINEISETSDEPLLTVPCVAQVVPRLLKKGFIHVEQFVPVNTKYARTFLPDITRDEYTGSELYGLFRRVGIKSALSTLVHINSQYENEELFQDLEAFIQEYKRTGKG